jgi:hypothetical protein
MIISYEILVEKPEGKRTLGRPRNRWGTIKWILRERDGKVYTGLKCLTQHRD